VADPGYDGAFAVAAADVDAGRALAAARRALVQRFVTVLARAWAGVPGASPQLARDGSQALTRELENQLIAASRQGAPWRDPAGGAIHVRAWLPAADVATLAERGAALALARWLAESETGGQAPPSAQARQQLRQAILQGFGLP
jgi:hypothetical protein